MPPKKTVKALAAEIKKKNVAEANDIVATLKRTSQRDKVSSEKSRKHAELMEGLFDSAKTKTVDLGESGRFDAVANPATNLEKASPIESKKKSMSTAKELVSKHTSRKEIVVNSTITTNGDVDMAENGYGVDDTTVDLTGTVKSTHSEHVTAPPEKHRKLRPDHKPSSMASSQAHSSESTGKKPKVGHGSGYQYEIDCKSVADSIDVTHLQRYLESQLKVGGQKNNLGSTIKVCCEGQRVVVNSKVYLPKKSLRYLSRKYLKKNWNIRVVSKNVHSYEYKYVGCL